MYIKEILIKADTFRILRGKIQSPLQKAAAHHVRRRPYFYIDSQLIPFYFFSVHRASTGITIQNIVP